jgi:DNA-binding phage protein
MENEQLPSGMRNAARDYLAAIGRQELAKQEYMDRRMQTAARLRDLRAVCKAAGMSHYDVLRQLEEATDGK